MWVCSIWGRDSACAGTVPMCCEGGPTFRPMRGDIDGPAFRCLSRCWAPHSGLRHHTGFLAGKSAPERCDPGDRSPAFTNEALWIGWQAAYRVRFWLHMAERCADQDDMEHVSLRLSGLMQRPELIPARLLAALVTPEFHRGEGFSRLFLDSPWSSGRLLTLPATIPAIPQVFHLRISLRIHLHRGVI